MSDLPNLEIPPHDGLDPLGVSDSAWDGRVFKVKIAFDTLGVGLTAVGYGTSEPIEVEASARNPELLEQIARPVIGSIKAKAPGALVIPEINPAPRKPRHRRN